MTNYNTTVAHDIIDHWQRGRRTRRNSAGWVSANAVCCTHRGESADTRQRAGMIQGADGGVSYSCFNCGFKAGWHPGHPLSHRMRQLLNWIGVSDHEINRLALESLRTVASSNDSPTPHTVEYPEVDLPTDSVRLDSELVQINPLARSALEYAQKRGISVDTVPIYWSSQPAMQRRIILPFTQGGRLVGWSARLITPGKPKYLSHKPPGYVYNLDAQTAQREYCIVCEGLLDAAVVDGVALLGGEINEQQAQQLQRIPQKKILVPDRDRTGERMVERALELEFAVSMPNWDPDVKDVNDAVRRYGRLYTVYSIIQQHERSALKTRLHLRKWFHQ